MSLEGVIYRGNSGLYHVKVHGSDESYTARLKGNLKKELIYNTSTSQPLRVQSTRKRRTTDPVAVGDAVVFDPQAHLIEEVLPRRSELARTSPSSGEQHVLVANLDTVYVVVAAANPQPDLWQLDRFLVLAEAGSLEVRIILNKCDLVPDLERSTLILDPYRRAGYAIDYVSASDLLGIDKLKQSLFGKISAFAGPSGVGKSSLLNRLKPGLTLKTAEIGKITHKGRHTTTAAELIALDDMGTWVADTPGLRQVDFWDVPREDIVLCFPEFKPYLGLCQYGDCDHADERGCAVTAHVASGEIDERRYRSFRQLLTERASSFS